LRWGTAADSSSTCFGRISSPEADVPVKSPPGLDKLATRPAPTASPALTITIGTPGAPSRAERIGVVPSVTISFTGTALSALATARWRCGSPPA
jgi:hypothetical protein